MELLVIPVILLPGCDRAHKNPLTLGVVFVLERTAFRVRRYRDLQHEHIYPTLQGRYEPQPTSFLHNTPPATMMFFRAVGALIGAAAVFSVRSYCLQYSNCLTGIRCTGWSRTSVVFESPHEAVWKTA
jgi:hypothetical protein